MGTERNKSRRIMASIKTLINATTFLFVGHIALTSLASEPLSNSKAIDAGRWSLDEPANEHVQAIADSVQSQLEDLIYGGRPFPQYHAIKYSTQMVAGKNWCILVQIAEVEYAYIQIIVFEPLSNTNETNNLWNVQIGMNKGIKIPVLPIWH